MQKRIITAVELRAFIASKMTDSRINIVRNNDGVVNWSESSVCDINTCSQASLEPEQRLELNEFGLDNIEHISLQLNVETASEILGLQICDPTQIAPIFKSGQVYYSSAKNSTNRDMSEARASTMSDVMINVGWCFGPGASIDCYGLCTTIAHRSVAAFLAEIAGGACIPVWIDVAVGGVPHFADVYDINKTNTASDIFSRDPERIPMELFTEVCEEIPDAATRAKWRGKALKELVTLMSNLHQRTNGKNVHAGGGSVSLEAKESMLRKFARVGVTSEIDKLMLMVFARSMDSTGKARFWVKQCKQNLVALVVVLLSNRSPQEDGTYKIDWELASSILTALADSSVGEKDAPIGPFGVLLAAIARGRAKAKLGKSTYSAEAVMDMLVGFLGKYPESTPDTIKNSFEGKRKAADTYLCFGGVDIGKQVVAE